ANFDIKRICVFAHINVPITNASYNETNEIHGVSFIDVKEDDDLSFEDIQESYEEIVYRCCVIAQGEPRIEKTKNETGDLPDSDIKRYWESTNDNEGINLTWDNLSVNDWIKIREEKIDAILDTVLDKLDDSWFSETNEDEDYLDGITDYLEPTSYDGCNNNEDEAYKERCCNWLGSYSKGVEFEVVSTHNHVVKIFLQ
ncbi:hypothetical protein Tco_1427253, partial [Tanacetum coccineum]